MSGASSGSGFIINKEGYIVTNAHVVAPASDGRVVVTMTNGRKKAAHVHSMDLLSDIAVVKLDDAHEDMLPTISFGDSSKVRSGEFVIAIGSPMHLQNSASFGIVSATARHASELGISNNRSEYIQTDAAINMGNSGGPLVNLDGEVIGINTMKVKGTDGISFAIPIDIAVQIVNQLLTNKRVIRPYVGLKMANMVPNVTESSQHSNRNYRKRHTDILSTEETKVVVLDVVKGSPAHNCGIMR
jgi:HtrA serine peptidase 2